MKQRFILHISLSVLFFFSLASCSLHDKNWMIQEGDLLFQDLDCGPLCDAIEAVTVGAKGNKYSHCALAIRKNDSIKVIEAIGSAVMVTDLNAFLGRCSLTSVGRLKGKNRKLVPKAIAFSMNQIGTPYDDVFEMNNGRYYCSELIYDAFAYANANKPFFVLEPMTFNDPVNRKTFPAWQTYFNDLKVPIPERHLGINPGLISRSKHIRLLRPKGSDQ